MRVRHGLKVRFPASGMRVLPALHAGRRRIGRRGAKGPAVRRAASRVAASVRRVGMTASVRLVGLKVVANVLRVVLMVNVAKALRAASRVAANVLRVGMMVSVRPAGLKVAANVANALRAVPTANALKVHPAGLKVVAIAATALRVALTVNAAKALRAALKAAQVAATAHPAVSKATGPRAATMANAARSVVRARVQAVRRKVDHVASVRHVTPRIGLASAATVAPLRSAVPASAGRAATAQHRAVLKASVAPPSVASARSRNPSKAATVTARTVRRAHRVTTAANEHQPNVNSAIVQRVPANVANRVTGANALLAASTRRCRPPAAALATTTAPLVPTNRAARHRRPEPSATMTPTSPRAHRVEITKMHRARCACPS